MWRKNPHYKCVLYIPFKIRFMQKCTKILTRGCVRVHSSDNVFGVQKMSIVASHLEAVKSCVASLCQKLLKQ